MFLTRKPKFHRFRNQMNNSRKKKSRKNNFPMILCFPSAMSHMHKSTKMGFPGNQLKITQLHQNITSSEMVVRGWYMTHFWPQGPPKLQKIGLGWFPQLTRPPRADLRIFRIFLEISRCTPNPRKTEFLDFRVRKKCSKIYFFNFFWNFQKIWYFSSILVYLHRAYSQRIKNNNLLKS